LGVIDKIGYKYGENYWNGNCGDIEAFFGGRYFEVDTKYDNNNE
jgi:hypothetical protein